MTRKEAEQKIKKFVTANKGKSVLFGTLEEDEKLSYVLLKSYRFFRAFLSKNKAVDRAIINAESHSRSNYEAFDLTEHLVISDK